MILGLDASTKVCGWCLLDDVKGDVLKAGCSQFRSSLDLCQRLSNLRADLMREFNHHEVRRVFIEEPKMMFGNKSTAHVISLLQRWNGMVSAMLWFDFGLPILVNESRARKAVGITLTKGSQSAKQQTTQQIFDRKVLPDYVWQYKKTGALKDHCSDIVDAYVVARAGFLIGAIAIS